ncbi:MAG: hypothetical protein KAR05_09095 [Candidatus Omnitrophica bacterium]|nr:hypothetical protein [Candidatus Omnitrophota bacterium]
MGNKKIFENVFLILIFFICCFSFYRIFFQAYPVFQAYSIEKNDSEKKWRPTPIYLSALEAKMVIPDGEPINITPSGFSLYRMIIGYIMHPLQISRDWNYFIDFENSYKNPPQGCSVYSLGSGVHIYVKPGYGLISEAESQRPYSAIKVIAVFFAVTSLSMGAAILMLRVLEATNARSQEVWFWGASYIIGFLFLTIVVWLFLLLGGKLERMALLILWVTTSLVLLLFNKQDEEKHALEAEKFLQSISGLKNKKEENL